MFHLQAIEHMHAAIAEEREARRTAHAARILAQTSCPHEDRAELKYENTWGWRPYRICLVCGLTLEGYQPAVLARTDKKISRDALAAARVGGWISVDAFRWHPDARANLARYMQDDFDRIWGES